MSGRRNLLKAVDKTQIIKQDYQEEISALLGVTKDGQKLVNVPDRPGYVYARIRGNLSELVQAFNDQVTGVYDLPVLLVRDYIDKGRFRVKSRDLGKYENWGSVSYVPRHAETHVESNNDPVYITSNQILDFKVVPSGLQIQIWKGALFGNNFETPGQVSYWDFSSYVPATGACWQLVYLDRLGEFNRSGGITVDTISLLTPTKIPRCPFGAWPIAAIRLYAGQTDINPASDILNLRWSVLPYNCAVGDGGEYDYNQETISSGIITARSQYIEIYSETGSGTADNLDTIWGGAHGSIITLHAPTDPITVRSPAGNILLPTGDWLLVSPRQTISLIFDATPNLEKWLPYSGHPLPYSIGITGSYTQFDATGHQTMVGNARPWRDSIGELLGKKRVGVRITEDLTEGTLIFSNACQIADDYVVANVQFNHDRDSSAQVSPHIHWFQNSNATPNWFIQYRWQMNGNPKVTPWTSAPKEQNNYTYVTGTILQITDFPMLTPPTGSNISDIVQFRISRDTDNDSAMFSGSDAYTGNADALSFDVHIQLSSLGSTDEYTK